MRAAVNAWRHPTKRVVSLMAVLAAIFSVLSIGAMPAAAASVRSAALDPGFYVESGDARYGNAFHPFTAAGAAAAQRDVTNCSGAFCTIQIDRNLGYPRYEVSWLWGQGCVLWRLHQVTGSFHTKNGGRYAAFLENSSGLTIAQYLSGRHTIQNWDPVYFIRTCN